MTKSSINKDFISLIIWQTVASKVCRDKNPMRSIKLSESARIDLDFFMDNHQGLSDKDCGWIMDMTRRLNQLDEYFECLTFRN